MVKLGYNQSQLEFITLKYVFPSATFDSIRRQLIIRFVIGDTCIKL